MSKTSDYALTALAYLAERPGRVASAREIAEARNLPPALLMNILKRLQARKFLRSTRGVRGGYMIDIDLATISVFELMRVLDCDGQPSEPDHTCEGGCNHCNGFDLQLASQGSEIGAVQALHFKLIEFLRQVTLADLVLPGRRIDVPIDGLRLKTRKRRGLPVLQI